MFAVQKGRTLLNFNLFSWFCPPKLFMLRRYLLFLRLKFVITSLNAIKRSSSLIVSGKEFSLNRMTT